jgi:D-3-phosphoglycerate dehydrogenase
MKHSPLVVLTDSPFPNLEPTREALSSISAELRVLPVASEDSIIEASRDADAVLVTYAKITARAIVQMTRCRVISRFGIGVDNVDIEAATRQGIRVTRIPDYCLDEVSDHTLALLLALARKIPFANSMVHNGRWDLSATTPIHRLRGSVLGLLGFGRISRLVAQKAAAFGMRVIATDPYASAESIDRARVERVDFEQLLSLSDYVSIHSPLLPETRHLFSASAFHRMKNSAYLINTARGPIVDETALVEALEEGQIAGAALDVLSEEPPTDSRLFRRDDVILTPHMSFYSIESLAELQKRAAEEVVYALTGRPTNNAVSPEALNDTPK